MTEETLLDQTHAAMQANADDDAARVGFYQALADAELFLLLTGDPQGDQIEPELLEMDGARYALVFDTDWRLSRFTEEHLPGAALPYAALPGRVVAGLLRGQKIGLGLNLGVAPSSILIPEEALGWLADMLTEAPVPSERPIVAIEAARTPPEPLVKALAAKLTSAGGLAAAAALAQAQFGDGSTSLIVGFTSPWPGAEPALAHSVQEAVAFSGIDNLELEVGFFTATSIEAQKLNEIGLPLPMPLPEASDPGQSPAAPGSDPEKPPILK